MSKQPILFNEQLDFNSKFHHILDALNKKMSEAETQAFSDCLRLMQEVAERYDLKVEVMHYCNSDYENDEQFKTSVDNAIQAIHEVDSYDFTE